jgi:hypothetical protein
VHYMDNNAMDGGIPVAMDWILEKGSRVVEK